MKIALAQLDAAPGDVEHNLQNLARQVEAARQRGADLVVFPEMADLGYDMQLIVDRAQPWDTGPARRLSELAAAHGIAIVAGIAERDGPDIYNTLAIVDRGGQLRGRYRKIHLITAEPVREHHYLRRGDALALHDIAGVRCGFMTCYDIRFPEIAGALTDRGAQVLVTPSAFPLVRGEHWKTILTCRAIENQVYVAAPNRIGTDAGVTFGGSSRLIDPYGVTLASASEIDADLLVGRIDPQRVAQVRSRMQQRRDRLPELYQTWVKPAGDT